MGIRLRLNKGADKGTESINVAGGFLSNVTGKITLKTPFGHREVASDGSLKGGRVKIEPVIAEPVAKVSTPKTTPKLKKGSK